MTLEEINIKIGDAETRGNDEDRQWFSDILASKFVLKRAGGKIVDRSEFLENVGESPSRHTEIINPIQVYGDRAIVKCIVTMEGVKYHNLRLFIRQNEEWKLLSWANEPLP